MSAVVDFRHHNNPPPDLLVGDALLERLRDDNAEILERLEQLVAAAARVPAVTSDDVAGKVSDYIKQLTALHKTVETKRVSIKEPYLDGGRNVDGFFKSITGPLDDVKGIVQRKLTTYLREKEDQARRARLEQERIARDAAEKAAKEAAATAAAAADAASLDVAIEAERTAEVAAADLAQAVQASDAKPAELTRTRGEYGSMSSLRTEWVFEDIQRTSLDLEALRPYLPSDGLEKAIRAFIKAGGRELRGVTIYESTKAVVR